MPLVYEQRLFSPYLVYDAPVDEKTKKLREHFKIDEETGYPECYKWRNQAKLGKSYKPEDPFLKFKTEHRETYQDTLDFFIVSVVGSALIHKYLSYWLRRPVWAKPHHFLFMAGTSFYGCYWAQQKSIERQAMRTAAVVDYARQHPERFGETQRYKLREVLCEYRPRR